MLQAAAYTASTSYFIHRILSFWTPDVVSQDRVEILIDPDTRRDKLIVATRRESSCRCHVLQSLMGCRMCAFWRTWVRDDVDLVLSSAQVSPLERRFEHFVTGHCNPGHQVALPSVRGLRAGTDSVIILCVLPDPCLLCPKD